MIKLNWYVTKRSEKKLGRLKLVTPTWKNQLGKSGSFCNEIFLVSETHHTTFEVVNETVILFTGPLNFKVKSLFNPRIMALKI